VHILLIPKKEIASHSEVSMGDRELMGYLIVKAKEIALKKGLEKGWRLVINNGDDGGQTVYHIHIHILGGRFMGWPPG